MPAATRRPVVLAALSALLLAHCSAEPKGSSDTGAPDLGRVFDMFAEPDVADLTELLGSVVVTPTMVTLSENGGRADVMVSLGSAPSADVVVTAISSNPDEVTVAGPLTFTTHNWFTPQGLQLVGVDNVCLDGAQSVEVALEARGVGNYADVTPVAVSADVNDDDSPSVSVYPTGVSVTENGQSASFSVVLGSGGCEMVGSVTIPIAVSSPGQIETDVAELVFTQDNFAIPQEVVVVAVDDNLFEPAMEAFVILGVASGGGYDGVDPTDVSVTVLSDDDPTFTVTPTVLTTSESGTIATFDVNLTPTPPVPVHVQMTSDVTEGELSPMMLTFDGTTDTHTVTVKGVPDDLCDSFQLYSIDFAATSGEPRYDGLAIPSVVVENANINESWPLVYPSQLMLSEGSSGSFTVVLDCDPMGTVTLDVAPDAADVAVSPTTVTFDSTNFLVQQTVGVSAIDNAIVDGQRTVRVNLTSSQKSAEVTVYVQDDD